MAPADSPELLDLQRVVAGRYLVERELGRGGMGVVFLARDVALERPVAIKVLPRHLSGVPSLRERFIREARTAAQLMHPNIVPIHLVEVHDDCAYFVMALVDGETLAERVARSGVLSAAETVRVMQEVAWALGYAHGRGVVHRDIKPENILLERGAGRALVADFGIARVASQETLSPEGATLGTVPYMSPEQAEGEPVDGRSDLYSLGATMYFALTGASPVQAPALSAMLVRLLTEAPVPVSVTRPELPPPLSDAVMKCLAKRPDDRFDSADALGAALRDATPYEPAMLPEVRSFLREIAAAQQLPQIASGLALLAGAAYKLHFMDARSAMVLVLISATMVMLFPISVFDSLSALRKRGISVDEMDRALRLESEYTSASVAIKMRDMGKSARALNRGMGAAFAVFGISVAVFVQGMPFWWTTLVQFLSAGLVGLGSYTLWRTRDDRPMPLWMHNPDRGLRVTDRIERWPLEVIRKIIRVPWIRHFLERGHGVSPPQIAENVPTSSLLVNRVGELLQHIPTEMFSRLGPVRDIAQALGQAIARLRQRETQLRAAAAQLAAGCAAHGEFLAALTAVQNRIVAGTAALDGLRVNLLRLDAGLIAVDGITAEIEKAQELGVAIEAELYAQDEMRRIGNGG